MPRPALQPAEIESFRRRLCDVALQRFGEQGYDGFTLRGLTAELGCSPTTPYRYFRNKAEIFAAVQALAFERFADALQARIDGVRDPLERIERLGLAYLGFARSDPHAYRIMFQLHPTEADPDTPRRGESRSWSVLLDAVRDAIGCGALEGEAELLALLYWTSLHGIAALELTGKFELPREELAARAIAAFVGAHRPRRRREKGG